MPQQTPGALDGGLRRLQWTKRNIATRDLLDRAHAHREMKPVKNMPHWLSGRCTCRIVQERLRRERKVGCDRPPLPCPLSHPDTGSGDPEQRGCGRHQSSPRLACSTGMGPPDSRPTMPPYQRRSGASDCVSSHDWWASTAGAATTAAQRPGMSADCAAAEVGKLSGRCGRGSHRYSNWRRCSDQPSGASYVAQRRAESTSDALLLCLVDKGVVR
jgi:hypothetical protein